MINADLIANELSKRVKTIQRIDPCVPRIAPDLIKGNDNKPYLTGVREVSNFMTPEFVFNTHYLFRQQSEANYPIWDTLASYQEGDLVQYNDGVHNFIYVARQSSVGQIPAWDSDYWETNLSAYFRACFEDAAAAGVQSYFDNIQSQNDIAETMAVRTVFDAATAPENYPLGPAPEFIGMRIQLASIQHLQVQFKQLGIFCYEPAVIPFYLYHTSQILPVAEFRVTLTPSDVGKFVWKDIENSYGDVVTPIMNYVDNEYNTRGVFFFGFYSDDLPSLNWKSYEWNGYFSSTLNNFWSGNWQYWFNQIIPTRYSGTSVNKPNIPNFGNYAYLTSGNIDNYAPFNIRMVATCNYAYPVEQNPSMFDTFLLYSTVERILQEIHHGTRKNEFKAQLDNRYNQIMFGIFTDKGSTLQTGVLARREEAQKALTSSLQQLDDVCFKRLQPKQVF